MRAHARANEPMCACVMLTLHKSRHLGVTTTAAVATHARNTTARWPHNWFALIQQLHTCEHCVRASSSIIAGMHAIAFASMLLLSHQHSTFACAYDKGANVPAYHCIIRNENGPLAHAHNISIANMRSFSQRTRPQTKARIWPLESRNTWPAGWHCHNANAKVVTSRHVNFIMQSSRKTCLHASLFAFAGGFVGGLSLLPVCVCVSV